jgi:SAM-dependent methyltransferase
MAVAPEPSVAHWDDVAAGATAVGQHPATWRRHCDRLNRELVERCLDAAAAPGGAPLAAVLKTDCFDESVGEGLFGTLAARAERVVAIDVSPTAADRAAARHPALEAVVADVRALPFAEGAFDAVVSNSTLDHFPTRVDLVAALVELRRVLRRGGTLVISLDNPANPLVAARNVLPGRVRYGSGLVPYYVGATAGPWRLPRLLRDAGFAVEEHGTLMHCPRVLAVPLAARADAARRPGAGTRLLGALHACEALERTPLRRHSGHFVWARATAR